jgi:hypothetical protein
MSEYPHFHSDSEDAGRNDLVGQDDTRDVLVALQRLVEQTSHPVARACLEQAYEDILYLTAGGEELQDEDAKPVAAA